MVKLDAFTGLLTIYNIIRTNWLKKTINRIIGLGELNINFLYIKPEEVINNHMDYLIQTNIQLTCHRSVGQDPPL